MWGSQQKLTNLGNQPNLNYIKTTKTHTFNRSLNCGQYFVTKTIYLFVHTKRLKMSSFLFKLIFNIKRNRHKDL